MKPQNALQLLKSESWVVAGLKRATDEGDITRNCAILSMLSPFECFYCFQRIKPLYFICFLKDNALSNWNVKYQNKVSAPKISLSH